MKEKMDSVHLLLQWILSLSSLHGGLNSQLKEEKSVEENGLVLSCSWLLVAETSMEVESLP